jgi:hypothetical protein
MVKVFISYANEDLAHARGLYNDLKEVPNVEPWLDKECLPPGMKWRPAIRREIRNSRFFIRLISKTSIEKKGHGQTELKQALEILDEFPDNKIFIIPIRLEECEIPEDCELGEINHVDIFPEREEGIKKVLNVIYPRYETDASEKISSSNGYEYRVGIVDIDVGLTNLPEIAKKLNSIQSFFHFTNPTVALNQVPVKSFEDNSNFAIHELPHSFYEQEQYLNVDLLACVSKYPLAFETFDDIHFNYHSVPSDTNERFMFISAHLLYDFTKEADCTFENGIVHLIISQLLVYFTTLGFHEETRGCLMDFCEERSDLIEGLKENKLCTACLEKIENTDLRKAIIAILNDNMQV